MREERLIMKGQLASLEQEKFRLAARIQGKLRSVKATLAMSSAREIHELDLRSSADELSEAADLREQLIAVRKQIEEIQTELAD